MDEFEPIFDKPLLTYDSSNDSEKVLKVFQEMKPGISKAFVLHVNDPNKRFMPPAMRGDAIARVLEQRYGGDQKVALLVKPIQEGKSVNDVLLETYLRQKCNILFLGYSGLKGRKVNPMELSSRLREFIYDTKLDIAVIKSVPKQKNNALFCSDGSEVSLQGLKKAIRFCKTHKLALTIFHATNSDLKKYSKQVKNTLKAKASETKGIQVNVLVEQVQLVSYLQTAADNYDWIVLNKNGYRGEISKKIFVGSNTTDIVTQVEGNILLLN